MNPNRLHHFIEGAILLAVLALQGQLSRWLVEPAWFRGSRLGRLAIWTANGLIALWLGTTLVSTTGRAMMWFPRWRWLQWNVGMAIGWAMFICGVFPLVFLLRRLPPMDPSRRKLLRMAHAAAVAAPLAVIGFGIAVSRQRFELKEVEIAIPGLPKDLDGLRLAQLTDIHLGPFLSNSELARVVGMANQTRPHVALVTGDLISFKGDPLDDCLRLLAGLRAEAGILGCLGNHEAYASAAGYATDAGARLGIEFLRTRSRRLRFGGSILSIAGVDYLAGREPQLPAASGLVTPGAVNVLLSHNPNAFPSAARRGFDLTISGHTHGGQVTMEVLSEAVTLIRFVTPYVQGLFRDGPAALYVSRGIGTVGVPARIGARPEVTLIRLCAI
ncbi:MAG: metallophosphoesterase [Acidobacteria bacterium]|nr:metallophosphoesterase [Acidobacteriota bacterium]